MKLHNDTIRTVNVWEVEEKREDNDEQRTRKRKRKNAEKQNIDKPPLSQQPMPSLQQPQPQLPVTESDPAHFEFSELDLAKSIDCASDARKSCLLP